MATSIEDCKKYIEATVKQYRFTIISYEDLIEQCWRAVWPVIEKNAGNLNWFAQNDPEFNNIVLQVLQDYLNQQNAFDNRDRYAYRKNYP